MRFTALFGLTAILALALSPSPSFADGSVSGKNMAAESVTGLDLPLCEGPLPTILTAQINKGKKKRVLVIEVFMRPEGHLGPDGGFANDGAYVFDVLVNSVEVEPSGVAQQFVTCDLALCNGHGSFWLDLDAAEAANPGQFIKQPLTITLRACDWPDQTDIRSLAATLVVRMEKK